MLENNTYVKTRPNFGYRVDAWMIHELGLSGAAKDAYAVIYAFTYEGGWKQLDWPFLAEMIGASVPTIRRVVAELEADGLVEKNAISTRSGLRNEFRAIVPDGCSCGKLAITDQQGAQNNQEGAQNNQEGAQNNQTKVIKISTQGAQNNQTNINRYKRDINTHTNAETNQAETDCVCENDGLKGFEVFAARYPKPPSPSIREQARNEWRRLTDHGWTLDSIEKRLIAHLAELQQQNKEKRYWPNLYVFLASHVEVREDVYSVPSPAAKAQVSFSNLPASIRCEECGGEAKHDIGRTYWCPQCKTSIGIPNENLQLAN